MQFSPTPISPSAHFLFKILSKLLMLLMMPVVSSRPGVNVVVGDKTRSTPGLYSKGPLPFFKGLFQTSPFSLFLKERTLFDGTFLNVQCCSETVLLKTKTH